MNNMNYLIKPFTIDECKTNILDDGFSITTDSDGNPILNIHVPLISYEYLRVDYKLNELMEEIFSVAIRDYLDSKMLSKYSLQQGTRKVLTLQIGYHKENKHLFKCFCEEIEIANNYVFNEHDEQCFYEYLRYIFKCGTYQDDYKMVTDLMRFYSYIFSKYLFCEKEIYMVKNSLCKYDDSKYQRGSFTSPLRRKASFINQFILLNNIKNKLGDSYLDNPLWLEKDGNKVLTYTK